MAGPSQGRGNSEMNKYWNEVALTKHQFSKAMFGDFQHQMMIPKKFVERFMGELGEWCTLRGPSGDIWRVRVTQSRDDHNAKLFSEGWAQFVKDNGIKVADSLVFSSSPTSNAYDVSIFDMSGCEREGAFFTRNSSNLGEVELGDESEPEPEPEPQFESEDSVSVWLEDHQQQHRYSSSSSEDNLQGSQARGRGVYRTSKRRRAFQKSQGFKDSDEDSSSPLLSRGRGRRPCSTTSRAGAKQRRTVYESKRRQVSVTEVQRAYDTATRFEMANRHLGNMVVIPMLPTHVYHGFHLTIPKEWALEHMIRKDHDVILRVPGMGKWIVSCRWTPVQCQLRPRWPIFVWDNNLEEHDVCVFELIKKGDLRNRITPVLNVHIFRVVDKCTPLEKIRS